MKNLSTVTIDLRVLTLWTTSNWSLESSIATCPVNAVREHTLDSILKGAGIVVDTTGPD